MAANFLEGTPYRAIRKLGAGGMGEVFEAEHVGLKKRVVVKVLHSDLAKYEQVVDRMRLEGQMMARLTGHRNLPDVTDIGVTRDGRPFLVMELLHGRTLRQELKARGPLPVREALDYVIQALEGIRTAHDAGLVHRDIKLDNLFLCTGGEQPVVKVLDFGVAKVVNRAQGGLAPLSVPTEDGTQVGTPYYFAPEQALGKAVDARSDLYAVGCTLFNLLTGRRPFHDRNDALSLAHAHLKEMPPPASSEVPEGVDVPEALDRAIFRAMAKLPENRFQSARELADELREILRTLDRGSAPARTSLPSRPSATESTPSTASTQSPMAPLLVVISACVFAVLTALVVILTTKILR